MRLFLLLVLALSLEAQIVQPGAGGGGATSQPYDLPFSLTGQPSAGSTTTYVWVTFVRPVSFPANFAGAYGTVSATPTATATFTVTKRNGGTAIGTVVVSTSGTFTFTTTGGATVSAAAGDCWVLTPPATQDATLAGLSFTVTGTR